MAKLPSSPCNWGCFPNNSLKRIYAVIGAKGTTVPKNLHGEWTIDGWHVVVKRAGSKAKGGKPRIFVQYEGRLVPAGRVRQALCRLNVHRARKRAFLNRGAKGQFVWAGSSGATAQRKRLSWIGPKTPWTVDARGRLTPRFQLTPAGTSAPKKRGAAKK